MAIIYNSELSAELIKGAKIQVNRDKVPNEIAEKVVPVMEVNPRLLKIVKICRQVTATNPASATVIYTTPSNQDFYLCGTQMSAMKNVTSDLGTGPFCSLNASIDGVNRSIISFTGITLTAQERETSIDFNIPIKIDRGTTIVLVASTAPAAGTYIRTGSIWGYIDEQSLA
jgi:hypothetical protein